MVAMHLGARDHPEVCLLRGTKSGTTSTKDEAHLHRQSSLCPAYAYGLKLPNKEPVVIPLLHLPLLTPALWMGGTGVHKRIVVFYNVESTIVSSNSMDSCSIID